mgnify:CR=1 FL=1
MVVLVSDEKMLHKYVKEIPPMAYELMKEATEPLTIIYPEGRMLDENVLAADGSVGIRIVKDVFCQKLINAFGKPIVSTSANHSGEKTPATFAEIDEMIKRKVDYIVNLRQKEKRNTKPSSIIKIEMNGEIKIFRK